MFLDTPVKNYEILINTPRTISVKKYNVHSFQYKTLKFQIENLLILELFRPVIQTIGLQKI